MQGLRAIAQLDFGFNLKDELSSVTTAIRCQKKNDPSVPYYLHFSSRVFRKPPCKMVSTMSHKVIPHFPLTYLICRLTWMAQAEDWSTDCFFDQNVHKSCISDYRERMCCMYRTCMYNIYFSHNRAKIFWLHRNYLRPLRNKTISEFYHRVVSHNSSRYYSNVSFDWRTR